jgi:DNA-binding PadR family transcriptional regulator
MARKSAELTIPDLVLLSLLAERPMHGYQANLELERRDVRDWANISRPQVYYSLDKLARLRLVHAVQSEEPVAGPERRVFATTTKGQTALAEALERQDWTQQRERPSFLIWLGLSWQLPQAVIEKQIEARRKFLEQELAREEATIRSIRAEVSHRFHEAVWMVSLVILQFRTELRWLRRLSREIHHRAPAKHPDYAKED